MKKSPVRLGLAGALIVAGAGCLCGPTAADAGEKKKPPTTEEKVAEAKGRAIERFRDVRKPSPWQQLLAAKLGPLKFANTPTADAAKVVAERLKLPLTVAEGIEGTVTYDKDGTFADFVREGLNPKYWFLWLENGKLLLKPFVEKARATVSSERGLHWVDHPEELTAVTAKCGGLKAYDESLSVDGAGAVTIQGRVCFIERVKAELKIKE